MVDAGILKPVHDSQPWINSFVIVESKDKQGKPKLRICLDPTNLNKAVIHEPYCFKTPEDIAHLLSNAVVLTTSDCNKWFWHQLLDEESSFLTTFNTEFGQFRFTVMPFGLSSAGDVFQRKLDSIFGKLPNIIVIADDTMTIGEKADQSDHDIAFTNLFGTAHKNGVKLNYENIQYKKNKVEFFGETYTIDGRKADPKKIEAIVKIPNPTNKKEVQTFLGMVQYLSKFSPRLSELSEPLRDLVCIHVPFIWQPEHT